MVIVGLTGGIGMGKSTVARMMTGWGLPVFNADRYVHRALNKGGIAVDPVAEQFPDAKDHFHSKIDRQKLRHLITGHKKARQKLEAILHPLVRAAEERFIVRHQKAGTPLVVLDIPLLFETGADLLCDVVICVSAPFDVQRARVLARPRMTEKIFHDIIKAQMPDTERRSRAQYVLETGGSLVQTEKDLQKILNHLKKRHAPNRS